jgi:hypothetical protein
MFALEDEHVLFLYCWTVNEMQIPATRDRCRGHLPRSTAPNNGVRRRRRSASMQPGRPGVTREGG